MLPNRATTVEMSWLSHGVTSPIPSHYHHPHTTTTLTHHHHYYAWPPPPPSSPPVNAPLWGQTGASSSILPAPNDPTNNAMSQPPNPVHNAPQQCHVPGPQCCPQWRKTPAQMTWQMPNDQCTRHDECPDDTSRCGDDTGSGTSSADGLMTNDKPPG